MKLGTFLQKSSNVYAENKLLRFVVMGIGIVTLINTVVVLYALRTQRTILLPAVIKSRITVSGDTVDESYVKEFCRYTMGLLLNYTPPTVMGQYSELLTLYAPDVYGSAKTSLLDMAESIKTSRTSSVFYIDRITVNTDKMRVTVSGRLRQYIDDLQVLDAQRSYMVRYRVSNGRWQIEKLTEKT